MRSVDVLAMLTSGQRSQLLDRLIHLLLIPDQHLGNPDIRPLWGCLQAEAVLTLIAGMSIFFPERYARGVFLHACLRKEPEATSRYFSIFVVQLCKWLTAQRDVSLLLAAITSRKPSDQPPTDAELHALIPKALMLKTNVTAQPTPLPEIRKDLFSWLMQVRTCPQPQPMARRSRRTNCMHMIPARLP